MPHPDHILVSGAAGGIGRAVCTELARRGAVPVVGYRGDAAAAEALAQAAGGLALPLDLGLPDSIAAAAAMLAAREQPLAGVVLAASPPPRIVPFGKTTPEDMALQWQVNVLGPQQLLALLVRDCFRKHKRGTVVGVLSEAMGQGIGSAAPNMGAYLAAKYGLQGLLAAAAADYPWLTVRTVSPGYTETPMLGAFDARFLDLQRARQPFQTAEQVAAMIVDAALAG